MNIQEHTHKVDIQKHTDGVNVQKHTHSANVHAQKEKIIIFDTTLRDGQQSPGAGMNMDANLQYAILAHELGIDVLEAGFPAASTTDAQIVYDIATEMATIHSPMTIAALCQLREAQFEPTMRALEPSQRIGKARVHTYLPVDPALMEASLGKLANQHDTLIHMTYRFIKMMTDAGYEVQFSPEGYSRMGDHFNFTTELICAAIEGGATTINCPDTIGGSCQREGDTYFVNQMQRHAEIIKNRFATPQAEQVKYPNHKKINPTAIIWSVHCHNDLGLALENTMNAVFDGPARQIEGCINGIGERAGNVALEQCLMYLNRFGDPKSPYFHTCHTQKLQAISNFIAEHMLTRQPHWPITGQNAARHTSGGHTNAILKNPMVYQPFDPKSTGNQLQFSFGPLSGGNHAKSIIEARGHSCDNHEKAAIAQFIKSYYAHRRKGITDDELMTAYFAYRKQAESTREQEHTESTHA